MPAETAKENKATVPYLPFKTFLSALDTLKHGIPNQIDRSVFPTLSGVLQGYVLNSFRFFGLIGQDGKPATELSKVIDDKERQVQIKKLLEKGYPNLFALGLANASPNSLDAELRKSGLTGDTHEKAKSFFLQAAKYSGVTLSPYLMKVTRTATTKKRVRTNGTKPSESAVEQSNGNAPINRQGPMKTIMLENNIQLSLGSSADLFAMTSADRKFVLELLDKLEAYEEEHPVDETTEDSGQEEENQ